MPRFTLDMSVTLRLGFSCLLISCLLLALHPNSSSSLRASNEGRRLRKDMDDKGIPLTTGDWGGGPRLLVDVQPQRRAGGWLPKQRLVLDTGSSTLAFCDHQMTVAAHYEASKWMSCNEYGLGGHLFKYWGPFVTGNLRVGHQTWKRSSYSIMEQETSMPCTGGIDGIFGIAFGQIDFAFPAESLSQMGTSNNFSCPIKNASHHLMPPLMHHLSKEHSQKIGIFWGAGMGKQEGRLYLGQAAVDNEHYAGYQQYAMAAKLVEEGWYNIQVESISIGNETFNVTCDPATTSKCVMDTGTPSLVLPPAVYEATLQQNGTMVIELAAFQGSINITVDIGFCQQLQWIEEGSEESPLILGLPLWAFYYTVFDLKAKEVVFVPILEEQSDSR